MRFVTTICGCCDDGDDEYEYGHGVACCTSTHSGDSFGSDDADTADGDDGCYDGTRHGAVDAV